MVAFEITRRYPDVASMGYVDLNLNPTAIEPALMDQIEREGLFWPVSVINGRAYADGLVTLPKALWAVDEELSRIERAATPEGDVAPSTDEA